MAQVGLAFSRQRGIVAGVVVIIILGVRLATLGESTDAGLEAAIRAELRNELGGELGKVLETVDPTSEKSVANLIERGDHSKVTLHSVRVSKPLLSFSSKGRAIVRLEYTLPGLDRRIAYWNFDHGLISGWRYRYGSSAVSYYLNFI